MMWHNKKLFADKVDSNPVAPPKKKRCTRKKGEDESENAATASTGLEQHLNLVGKSRQL